MIARTFEKVIALGRYQMGTEANEVSVATRRSSTQTTEDATLIEQEILAAMADALEDILRTEERRVS